MAPAAAFFGWRMVGVAFLVDFIAVGFFFYSFGIYYPAIDAEFPGGSAWVAMGIAVSNLLMAAITGDWLPPALDDLAARISPRPLFLIYATHGQGGENLNPRYYEAAGEPKQLWEITSGGHTGGLDAQGEEYERRVLAFFREALLG